MGEALYTRDILAELKRIGSSPAQISRELGVAKTTVTRWINGERRRNEQVRNHLAAKLGCHPHDLSPGERPHPLAPEDTGNDVAGTMSDYTQNPPRKVAEGRR